MSQRKKKQLYIIFSVEKVFGCEHYLTLYICLVSVNLG